MPIYIKGDMWNVFGKVDLFCITTNSFLKKNGEAVMGAGIAKQAAERYPELPRILGAYLTDRHLGRYALITTELQGQELGFFQVKTHWRDKADLSLITLATSRILTYCYLYPTHTVALNYPGIGNGHLLVEQVKPIIDILPSTVRIYHY